MRKTRNSSLLALSVAVISGLAACESDPFGHSAPSHFVASIEGGITASYEGTGVFRTTPPRGPSAFAFSLDSQGRGTARNQEFKILSTARPEVGTHALDPAQIPGTQWIMAQYSIRDGNTSHVFAAESGELVVTRSSTDRIEGSFHFTGVLRSECDLSRPNVVQCKVLSPSAERLRIQVSGSFEAVPGLPTFRR